MKTIKYIVILIFVISNYSCLKLCEGGYDEEKKYFYYPQKDTFSVGDTIWINLSFPKVFPYDCGIYTFTSDSILCDIEYFFINSKEVFEVQNWCEKFTDIKFTKGSRLNKCNLYFVYQKTSNRYENEFFYILNDTGKVFFGDMRCILILSEKISYKSFCGTRHKQPVYCSSFPNFDSLTTNTYSGFTLIVKP